MARTTGNLVQQGKTMAYTNAGANTIPVGTLVQVNAVFGIAVKDIPAGETETLEVDGVYTCPATAGEAVAQGVALYYITETRVLTTDGAGSKPCVGVAWAAKASGVTAVDVKINA